jgi:hypothetical protein
MLRGGLVSKRLTVSSFVAIVLAAVMGSRTATVPLQAQTPTSDAAKATPRVKWAEIPLSFEPNLGQESSEVRYLARGSASTLYLADTEMVLSAPDQAPLEMKFAGANRTARMVGEDRQVSVSNYLIGNDPGKWRTSVPNYARARYRSVYPGIDLVFYGRDGNLEYDWIVSPSADPRRIRLHFDGADRLRVDDQGQLVIDTGKTQYLQKKPVVYQDIDGERVEVAGSWRVHGKNAAFRIGRYDRTQPLIIDPALYYSTYLGGSANDYAYGIAVDSGGNTYVTGGTASANFPTRGPLSASLRGSNDVFVTKISSTGATKVYSTFLGSTGVDEGRGIAVDSRGAVYVTGSAGFLDFPMKNPIQGTWGGSGDAFLAKLDPTGSNLVYSTYLGGNAIDYGTAIALDPAGNAYVTGVTFSANLPTVNPFQAAKGAQQDAFVAKINPSGSAWVYVTYLGGNSVDEGYGIAVDASGNAYITGQTQSTNFPVQSPFQASNRGGIDGFVTKLNPVGSALVYSTYLGGSGNDNGNAIAVDASGNAYVTGITASSDFPVANAIDITLGSHAVDDVFVTKFNPSGSALVYSTYLGGGSEDDGYAIALDKAGDVFITGRTNSSDFPLVNPIQVTRFAFDMFVTEINPAGSALLFSTFLGGSGNDAGQGIAVDALGNIHIAGQTTSTDFPVLKAIQTASGGVQDAIVLQFGSRVSVPFADFSGTGCSSGQFLYRASDGLAHTLLTEGVGTYLWAGFTMQAGFDTVRTGDFNGDGKADVILYNSSTGSASIGLGDGSGFYAAFQSLSWSPGYDVVETGDLNGDGLTDVVLYNNTTGTMYTGLSNGDGTFNYVYTFAGIGYTYVRLAAFTGSGRADLFLYRGTDGQAALGIGDGTGFIGFYHVPVAAGYDVADVGDLNGDGKADLILYRSATGATVTGINDGAEGFVFTAQTLSPGYTAVRLADFTGDGLADLFVYNTNTGSASLGIGTGTGAFNFQAMLLSPGYTEVVPEDVSCDGRADLILNNRTNGTMFTGLGNGDGTLTFVRQDSVAGEVLVDQNHILPLPAAPPITVSLDRQSLAFAAKSTGSAFTLQTGSQNIALTQSAGFPISWTATSDQPWLVVTPTSGNGSAALTVSIKFDPSVAAAGTATGHVNVAVLGASNAVGPITVTLNTLTASAPPFGVFDSPPNGSTGIAGSLPVTGWALDNVQATRVTICRDPVAGEVAPPTANCGGNAKIYVGDATFVDGARPDVQAANSTVPLNTRGGWGYLMLTNFLPSLGNGTFNIEAYAFNADGNTTLLGTKTITCNNAGSIAPFGAIDTPGQGAVVSGSSFLNFGWVLASGQNYADPPHGGTVQVFVDGKVVGSPGGWGSRADLTALFPASSYPGVSSALAVYGLDTTTLANGVHTIFWVATGTGTSGTAGIGSRFITVSNGSDLAGHVSGTTAPKMSAVIAAPTADERASVGPHGTALASEVANAPEDLSAIQGRRGYDLTTALQTYTPSSGRFDVQSEELDRIELHLSGTGNRHYSGYLQTVSGLQPLPVGSSLDASSGVFTWTPGVGFYGAYDLTFVRWSGGQAVARQDVRITLNAKGSNRVGSQTIIDVPGQNASVGAPFYLGGWAADLSSTVDSGVNTVHVWAYPIDSNGNRLDPIFIGPANYGGARPDVAAVYGDRFGNSGFGLIVNALPPGTYDIAAFAFSTVVDGFTPAKVVRIVVR